MSKRKRRSIVGAIVLVLALGVAGVAYSLWPASGSGSGRATSASAVALTLTATSGAADLYPGFTAGDIYFTVDNPNPYPVTFTSFTEGGIVSSDNVACPSTNVTVDDGGAINFVVAADADDEAHSIANVVSMSGSAPTGCQNKTFTITLSLSGTQST
jgi:hypothetical protein